MVLLKEWCTYFSKGEIQHNTPMRGVKLRDDDVNDTAVVAAETLPLAIPATVTITTMTEVMDDE
eukprot:11422005-Ditylum_brightwellii.AAC.1